MRPIITETSVTIPIVMREDREGLIPAAELEEQAVSVLSRAWVTSRMMKAAQIALGEVRVLRKQKRPDPDGGPPIEVEVEETVLNLPAANRALELLGHEVTRSADEMALVGESKPTEARRTVDTNKLLEGFTFGPGPDAKKN